jgi:hypothetical protein
MIYQADGVVQRSLKDGSVLDDRQSSNPVVR